MVNNTIYMYIPMQAQNVKIQYHPVLSVVLGDTNNIWYSIWLECDTNIVLSFSIVLGLQRKQVFISGGVRVQDHL